MIGDLRLAACFMLLLPINYLLLLKCPFWRRIWIVQELVLPLHLRLLCGGKFIGIPESDTFYKSVERLRLSSNGRPDSVPIDIWARLRECVTYLHLLAKLRLQYLDRNYQLNRLRGQGGISEFIAARSLLEIHKTSDLRGQVFGLLGLFATDIVPSYDEDVTVADVYTQVARHGIKAGPTNILSLAGSRPSCNEPGNLTLLRMPSWIPDWRLPVPARRRLSRYPLSHAFPSDGGLQMQIIDNQWLRGSAAIWDTVSTTECKTGWDSKEWDLVEKIDIEKPDYLVYPSGISRFDAVVLLWLGGYGSAKGKMCDLRLDLGLFRSYEVMFFANIARPWANKHGQHEKLKLCHHIFGQTGLISPPNDHREFYVTWSRQLRYDMRCFHTEKGYIGFGPLTVEAGDLVCVLEGHRFPVVLRRRGSHYVDRLKSGVPASVFEKPYRSTDLRMGPRQQQSRVYALIAIRHTISAKYEML